MLGKIGRISLSWLNFSPTKNSLNALVLKYENMTNNSKTLLGLAGESDSDLPRLIMTGELYYLTYIYRASQRMLSPELY